MEIDSVAEERVREVLDSAVKRDIGRFQTALGAFPDERSRRRGLELVAAICLYVLHDMYGGRPTSNQIRALADALVPMEDWASIERDETVALLDGLVDLGKTAERLAAEDVVMLLFVVTASLLASRSKAEDGKRWFDYLDRIEATIEATPDSA